MCSQQQLNQIMTQLIRKANNLFGESISEVILFGSYARNDADDGSDVDVMVLLDLPREEIPLYRRQLAEIAGDLLFDYGVVVSPLMENKAFFDRNRGMYPFFRNIDQEGIRYVA